MTGNILLVALGGAIGSVARYLATLAAARFFGPDFPWGTLFVNLAGSFLMGVVVEVVASRFGTSNELRLFLATGVLGGFTTFSTFSLDAAVLAERGAFALAFAYVGASLLLGLGALFAGLVLARTLA